MHSDLSYPGNGNSYNRSVEILQTRYLPRNSIEKTAYKIQAPSKFDMKFSKTLKKEITDRNLTLK